MPLPTWTNTQVLSQLNSGFKWGGSTITYAFPTAAAGMYTGGGEGNFSALSASAQNTAILALSLWDDLIAPYMQQVSPGSYTTANLEIGLATANVGYAHAYYPSVGSVWFNPTYTGSNSLNSPTIGRHGFATYIHEFGHALGLDHMGDYDATSTPSSYQDSTVYSIMSYYGPSWGNSAAAGNGQVAWADWTGSNGQLYSPQTPMLNDIMAMQAMYGVETTTRVGDTIYGFNSNITGNAASIYNFSLNGNPILTIFDSSGTDTLDVSGWSGASVISLVSGVFSSGNSMTNNIAIAYTAIIENARTGLGNDTVTGNDVSNHLDAGGGSDTVYGGGGGDILIAGAGSDTFDGGLGEDTLLFTGSFGQYTFTYDEASVAFTFTSLIDGTDIARYVEFFQFVDGLYSGLQLMAPADTPVADIDAVSAVVAEGNAGVTAVTFTITLDQAADSNQTINWQVAHNSTSAYDFVGALGGTEQFLTGETSKTITVGVASDNFAEADETFSVQITRGTTGLVIGAGTALVTLSNDDGAIPGDDFGDIAGSSGVLVVGGQALNGTIEVGNDVDMVRVDLVAGFSYALTVAGTGGVFSGSVALQDAGGKILATASAGVGNPLELTYLAATTGSYYLRISNPVAEVAQYAVTTELLPYNILSGTAAANSLIGYVSADHISGFAGNDVLRGNAGNDILDGGEGRDNMSGGFGDDIYIVDIVADRVVEVANQGSDLVQTNLSAYTLGANVEDLAYTGVVGFTGTGNSLGNVITGGGLNDRLNGGVGADRLVGLSGDDFYFVDNIGDVVVEQLNSGNDTVSSSVSVAALAQHVENLILAARALTANGNALANTITGNASANVLFGLGGDDRLVGAAGNDQLNGGDGNDTLEGGLGRDTLSGGNGSDRFVFRSIGEAGGSKTPDIIADFEVGLDLLDLSTIDASTLAKGDQAFTYIGSAAFTAAGQLRFDVATGTLFGNVNGDKLADFALILQNVSALNMDEFIL